ncbi:hypothetical protein P2H44_22660 [Albimonas sp. CAU 1670]|uniref:hypothetical protein n=1 Tax=Albimonas sp. CAU 1670 TaxID=3032599 RepID=UPI0023DA398B|nr:hypothetical protein [Albimonas sp. CAU 1670]MDF2235367.1 hypothetical protein [Albimonas sp. CAU 1670]
MTFFLSDKPTKAAPVNVAPERPAGWWETAGAAWNQTQVLQDTLFHGEMTDRALLEEINDQLGDASPYVGDGLQIAWERNGRWDPIRAKVLSAAARAARNEPGMWGSLPLNEDAFRQESRRRRMAELEDAQATLAMGSGMAAETLGGMARATTDPVSLAMLPAGGSGSLLRILVTEAALGAAGEAIALPQQYRVAQELDQPDPDPLVQIGLGAAAGGVLGTAPVAVSRGASRLVGRSETAGAQRPANAHPADHEARAASAEAAVREGRSINVSPPVADAQIATAARRIVGAESGGRAAAKNSESTATGLGQFIESTWLEVIGRNRPDIAAGRTRKELLALRKDPDLSWEMTVAYTRENAATLEAAGLSPSIENLYLAHFLGPGGAVRALTADPSAPISRVMDADQIQANRNISYGGRKLPGWTVADLRRWSETKMGLAEDPGDAWRASSRRGYTAPDQVTTPQGTRVAVTYEVVDLDELIFATGGRQNRDRSRPAPTAEVTRRAAELDPALLMPAASAGHGAPIVGPDRIIDSGNGRVMSILHAAQHVPDRYAAYVETIRSQFEIPAGVKRPVLVAVREELDGPTLERFVREANSDSIERLSATEQARTDAAAIDRDLLGLYDPEAGGPFGAGNVRFVQGLVDRLPPAERGQVLTADRRLSAQGRERLRSALFSRAYDAPDLTAAQAEQGGGDVRSIVEALTDAAPAWAQMRAAVEAGEIGEAFDLTADLLDAIRLVQQARREAAEQGVSVRGAIEDALAQGDMFGGGPSPATARLVGILYRGGQARSREAMADTLQRFALEARTVGAADDLLAGAGVRGPLDVLDTLSARLEAEPPRAGDAPDGADAGADGGPQVDVAGVDDARWNDGASSPAAIEGAAQAEAELRQEIGAPGEMDEIRAAMDEIRAATGGDFTIDTHGPEGTLAASEILADLEADLEFVRVVEICGYGGARNA